MLSTSTWIILIIVLIIVDQVFITPLEDHQRMTKYKVDSIEEYTNVRNRGESSLFKTFEECEQKCKEINQGESSITF